MSFSGAPPAAGAAPNPMANLLVGVYKGGNQTLPIAMSKRIKGALLQGKRVVAISSTDSGATVTCDDW